MAALRIIGEQLPYSKIRKAIKTSPDVKFELEKPLKQILETLKTLDASPKFERTLSRLQDLVVPTVNPVDAVTDQQEGSTDSHEAGSKTPGIVEEPQGGISVTSKHDPQSEVSPSTVAKHSSKFKESLSSSTGIEGGVMAVEHENIPETVDDAVAIWKNNGNKQSAAKRILEVAVIWMRSGKAHQVNALVDIVEEYIRHPEIEESERNVLNHYLQQIRAHSDLLKGPRPMDTGNNSQLGPQVK